MLPLTMLTLRRMSNNHQVGGDIGWYENAQMVAADAIGLRGGLTQSVIKRNLFERYHWTRKVG